MNRIIFEDHILILSRADSVLREYKCDYCLRNCCLVRYFCDKCGIPALLCNLCNSVIDLFGDSLSCNERILKSIL